MKKKRVVLSILLAGMLTVCSSCATSNVGVNVTNNGKATIAEETLLKKSVVDTVLKNLTNNADMDEEVSEAEKQFSDMDVVNVDGIEYYKSVESQAYTYDEAENKLEDSYFSGVSIDGEHAYFAMYIDEESAEMTDMMMLGDPEMAELIMGMTGFTGEQIQEILKEAVMNVSVTFPEQVTHSNAEKIDGNTASWSFTQEKINAMGSGLQVFYAETMEASNIENDKKTPTISGVENKKYYKKGRIDYKDKETGVAAFLLDGYVFTVVGDPGVDLEMLSEGKHSATVYDFAKNKKSVTFYVDKKKPTISGVKNNKTYKKAVKVKYSDKYGVKSAKINGKSFKSGKKVSKKGSYTVKVTDKAGNVKTVKFKIKK